MVLAPMVDEKFRSIKGVFGREDERSLGLMRDIHESKQKGLKVSESNIKMKKNHSDEEEEEEEEEEANKTKKKMSGTRKEKAVPAPVSLTDEKSRFVKEGLMLG